LFPLDTTCNWMITENTHPGACAVSEAVLCAGDRAPEVIKWAFDVQDRVRTETAKDPGAAERIVKQRFPDLAQCIGSPEAKSRLNKSLRWAVANNVRVLTPQLYIDGVKLCDEDVDLGLDYALSRMLDGNMPARTQMATPVEPARGSAQGSSQPAVVPPPSDETRAVPPPAQSNTVTPPPNESNAVTPPAGSNAPSGSNAPAPADKPVTTPSETPPADQPQADKPAPTPTDKPAADKPEGQPAGGSDTGGAP
jgi:hypothetical protein